jgi:formylglycine-generating enzyme required for sulfatase activity
VTNQQFAQFIEATQLKHDWVDGWKDKLDHPVVNVPWHAAMDYCRWLNEILRLELPGGTAVCLPSEAEWEKAARGEYGNEWPWGNEFDLARCNTSESGKGGTTPVRAYTPQGDSPCGCADMAGNVWEWTRSLYTSYPYDPQDGRENLEPPYNAPRVLRGGGFGFDAWLARCAFRYWYVPNFWHIDIGFRVVVSSFNHTTATQR